MPLLVALLLAVVDAARTTAVDDLRGVADAVGHLSHRKPGAEPVSDAHGPR
jgi:hypothetical protein